MQKINNKPAKITKESTDDVNVKTELGEGPEVIGIRIKDLDKVKAISRIAEAKEKAEGCKDHLKDAADELLRILRNDGAYEHALNDMMRACKRGKAELI